MSRTKTVLGWLLAIPLGSFGAVAVAGGQDTDKPTPHIEHQQQTQTPQQGSTKQPAQTQKQSQQTQQQSQPTTANIPMNAVALNTLEEAEVSGLQQKLKDMGFYRGEVDGKVGKLTRGALQRYFQRQAQLAGRGLVEQEAIAVFDIDVSDRVPVRGMEQQPGQQQGQQPQGQQQGQQGQQQTTPRPSQSPQQTRPSQPAPTE